MSGAIWSKGFVSIAGAPRCGTSALSRYLAEHPDVCFSRVKEPHYFVLNDLSELSDEHLQRALLADFVPRFFGHCKADAACWAEGSVSYLYLPDAARQLVRAWPETRFILAVRDPMELLPSLHQRSLFQGDEDVECFTTAWRLVERRKRGEVIPRHCVDARILRYDEAARLGHYLERFFEAVGRERCHVVVYDDFASDPGAVYRRILEFLGLPDDGRTDFPRVRDRKHYRIAWLQRALKRPPQCLRTIIGGKRFRWRVKRLDGRDRWAEPFIHAVLRLRRTLLTLNERPARVRPIEPPFRREIRDWYREDIAHLSRLLGRDLSHWLSPEDPQSSEARADRVRDKSAELEKVV